MAFTQPLDIYNSALQHCGRKRIWSTDEPSDAKEINACYDNLRLAELERNLWTFATQRVILRPIGYDTVLWTAPTWSSGSNYSAGASVVYTPTIGPYTSVVLRWVLTLSKTGSTTTPDIDPDWHVYAGPVAIDLYDTGITANSGPSYQAGEVVLVPATWDIGTTYAKNDVVNRSGAWYVSLIATNLGNDPLTATADWGLWTSQGRGNDTFGVTATNSPIPLTYPAGYSVYVSLYNNNADNPVSATGNWLSLGGTIAPLTLTWPVGSGPAHDITTANVFRLPYGFLRQAPTSPKEGQWSFLGATSGSAPEDYVFENAYLVSRVFGPLMLRFVANLIDVNLFHAMFAEALGARIADKVGPQIIEDKRLGIMLGKIASVYSRTISEARAVNAIEAGPVTPTENRYVLVRQ